MFEHRSPCASAKMIDVRAHRFDFTVLRIEFAQRAASGKRIAVPDRPEGDISPLQPLKIKEMAFILGRIGEHPRKMRFKQRPDFRARKIIGGDVHSRGNHYVTCLDWPKKVRAAPKPTVNKN